MGHLGSGQFGSVEQGVWKRHGTKPVDVALKSLNNKSSEEEKVKFLQEAAIMGQFRHPNVISLHGVMSRGKPVGFNYCAWYSKTVAYHIFLSGLYFVNFAKKIS